MDDLSLQLHFEMLVTKSHFPKHHLMLWQNAQSATAGSPWELNLYSNLKYKVL